MAAETSRPEVCDACALMFHTSVALGNAKDGCGCLRLGCGCRIKREAEAKLAEREGQAAA